MVKQKDIKTMNLSLTWLLTAAFLATTDPRMINRPISSTNSFKCVPASVAGKDQAGIQFKHVIMWLSDTELWFIQQF